MRCYTKLIRSMCMGTVPIRSTLCDSRRSHSPRLSRSPLRLRKALAWACTACSPASITRRAAHASAAAILCRSVVACSAIWAALHPLTAVYHAISHRKTLPVLFLVMMHTDTVQYQSDSMIDVWIEWTRHAMRVRLQFFNFLQL